MIDDAERETTNARQIACWNEIVGPKWVAIQDKMEARLIAIEDLLMEQAKPVAGERVLEIGCGTGTTTARLADAVGARGHVAAVDVSRPMLEAAHLRLQDHGNVTLVEADATTVAFIFDDAFDLLTSRFGIMFFGDPVAAFTNLHRALKPGGRLACIAWAPIDRNPHWSIPLDIAIETLGPPKPRHPRAPGPLAFDDPAYVTEILTEAGFQAISVRAEPVSIVGRSLDEEAEVAAMMGPAGSLLNEKEADAATRAEIRAAFRAALPGYADAAVRLPAMVHVITASRD